MNFGHIQPFPVNGLLALSWALTNPQHLNTLLHLKQLFNAGWLDSGDKPKTGGCGFDSVWNLHIFLSLRGFLAVLSLCILC